MVIWGKGPQMSKSILPLMPTSFLIHSRIQRTEITPVLRDPFEYRADKLMMFHTKLQSKFFNIPSDHRICATKMILYVMHLLSSCIYGYYLKPNSYGIQTVFRHRVNYTLIRHGHFNCCLNSWAHYCSIYHYSIKHTFKQFIDTIVE